LARLPRRLNSCHGHLRRMLRMKAHRRNPCHNRQIPSQMPPRRNRRRDNPNLPALNYVRQLKPPQYLTSSTRQSADKFCAAATHPQLVHWPNDRRSRISQSRRRRH
jgi:hypothetical protein